MMLTPDHWYVTERAEWYIDLNFADFSWGWKVLRTARWSITADFIYPARTVLTTPRLYGPITVFTTHAAALSFKAVLQDVDAICMYKVVPCRYLPSDETSLYTPYRRHLPLASCPPDTALATLLYCLR